MGNAAQLARTLHLVDLANLLGRGQRAPTDTRRILGAYRDAGDVAPEDHVIIAAPVALLFDAKAAWPAARVLRRGASPARSLSADFDPRMYSVLYTRVAIGSGDGRFSAWAESLSRLGVGVVVVCHPTGLSPALASAADSVIPLGGTPFTFRGQIIDEEPPLEPSRDLRVGGSSDRRWPCSRLRNRAGLALGPLIGGPRPPTPKGPDTPPVSALVGQRR